MNKNIKKYNDFLNESSSKSLKKIWNDIYSEINPVLKWKKMDKYHKELKAEVERLEKELEDKKKNF